MEDKVLIFGHKNPDTDSIISSLVMADFERKMGNSEVVSCRLGMVNKEYILSFVGGVAPILLKNPIINMFLT